MNHAWTYLHRNFISCVVNDANSNKKHNTLKEVTIISKDNYFYMFLRRNSKLFQSRIQERGKRVMPAMAPQKIAVRNKYLP